MKHTKQKVGMSHRIMVFVLTICMVGSLFSPIVSAQAEALTTKLCGFAELSNEIRVQSVSLGVPLENLNLPNTLEATALGDTEPVLPDGTEKQPENLLISIHNVTWTCNPTYSDATPGVYTFTAVLPEGYALQEGVVLPTILVTIAKEVTAYEKTVELFRSLPKADSITDKTTVEVKDAIRAQLDKAMVAYYALTVEEKAQFDSEQADLLTAAKALQSAVISQPLKNLPKANAQVDTFAKLQAAIVAAPQDGSSYVIEVTGDFEITAMLNLDKKNTNITIRGNVPERKLTRGVAAGHLFNVTSDALLTLENIVIDGNKDMWNGETRSTIVVQKMANLALNKGAVLQNNKTLKYGGAVYILDSAAFSMSGAKILNNEGRDSGGIFIAAGSTISSIDIANSVISGNTATNSGGGLCRTSENEFALNITGGSQINGNTAAGHGGGFFVGKNATVTMDGASQMNGNKSGPKFHGGAIYAADYFKLNMVGASQINNNTSEVNGGAIYATTGFTLNMVGTSQINGNAATNGGGIACTVDATFSIKDGSQINGNEATNGGGGIYNSSTISNFELDNSEICNNKASGTGGGIYAYANGFPLAVTGSSKINRNEATAGYGGGIAVVSKPFPKNAVVSFGGATEIVGNTAKYAGAFWLGNTIHDKPYTMYIQDTVKLQNNTAEEFTGGAYIRGANVIVSTSMPILGNKNTNPAKGSAAINVESGTLTLENGVCVKNNTGGAAVWVTNNSTLTLNSGSTITENTATYNGGGVYISTGSNIDMKVGSKITKNKAVTDGSDRRGGGGIYFSGAGGTIAGEISENTASDSGGGIYIHGNLKSVQPVGGPKLYIVDGAIIKNNTADYAGGGIYANGPKTNESIDPRAIVYVQGGEITGNTANGKYVWYHPYDSGGGGIAVARAQAEISGGTITGNTAKVGAGGVETLQQLSSFVGSGKLTISGGDINGNTSNNISDRTALNIQARSGGEIILTENLTNPQSLKVDTSSTLTLIDSSTITTQGNVTIGGNSRLITIDPNGGTVTGMVNFINGKDVVLPPASVLEGKEFGGWYDGEKIYKPGDTVAISKTVTYKAIWKYDVIYKAGKDANSGQADKKAIKYSDINLELLGATYKKTGHAQLGWAISDGGEKVYDLNENYTTDEAITLYPVWLPVGDINVDIEDENGRPVQGAKVKITQAEQPVLNGEEKNTDKKGNVTFTNLPYGIYNVVVTYTSGKDKIVVTKAIKINSTSLSVSVTLPNVRLNTEVVGKVPVAVENLESSITEEEKSRIIDSIMPGSISEIRIVLAATPEGDQKIADEINAAAGQDKNLTNYVDVTVTKTLKTIDADGTEVTGASQEIKTTAAYQTLSFAILPKLATALAKQEGATVENVLVYQRHIDEASVKTIKQLPKVSAQYGKVAQYDCYYIETVKGIPYIVVRAKNFSTYAFGLQEKTIDKYTPYIINFDPVGGGVTPVSAATNIDNTLDTLPIPIRSGYSFDGWYTAADGGDKVTTDTVFTKDSTIYAHWTYNGGSPINYYTITATADTGGKISPVGDVTVGMGESKSFTITANPDYAISDVKVDGVSKGAISTYTFANVTANHTIMATYEKLKGDLKGELTVSKTVTGGGNKNALFTFRFTFSEAGKYGYTGSKTGSISNGGRIQLKHGESVTITIPRGVTYTVVEDAATRYIPTPKSRTYTGTITATPVTANFENRYDEKYIPPEPTLTGSLKVKKTVKGDLGDKDKKFAFIVTFDADGQYRYIGSKSGVIESGDTLWLRHGEYVKILNLPEGTDYSVKERENSGYKVDASGETGVIVANDVSTAAFTNSRSSAPKTGDDNSLLGGMLTMVGGILGVATLLVLNGRKRRKNQGEGTVK